MKTYSEEEFRDAGIDFSVVEQAILSSKAGVLRGLHFQDDLKQSKLLTCLEGELWGVAVDVDKNSSLYGKWISFEMQYATTVFIPGKYALGTLALKDSMLHIAYGDKYKPERADGIRWDDSDLSIDWPLDGKPIVAERDMGLKSFRELMI